MSLINDALKRTREVHQQNPPPTGGPALKPADSGSARPGSGAKNLLYVLVFCVVVGNVLLFLAFKDSSSDTKKSANQANTGPVATTKATVAPVATAPDPVAPAVPTAPPTHAAAVGSQTAPAAPTTNASAPAVAPAVQAAPAPPAPLKLQSIIYNPNRPSAMVNGKFLFIGDKFRGFHVTAIDQETVTLVGNGQTNVLSLP